MKIFKALVAAIFFVNVNICAAGNLNGTVIRLVLSAPSTSTAPPSATVALSDAELDGSDPLCSFSLWTLPDLTDQFQKLAYATLLSAQLNGRSVSIGYTSTAGCPITSVQ